MSFNRNENDAFGIFELNIEDAKKGKAGKMKPGAKSAGMIAKPLKTGDPKKVGVLQRQKAPSNQPNTQSVGGSKLGVKGENSTKTGWEGVGQAKQAQETKRPSPKAIRGKGREGKKA